MKNSKLRIWTVSAMLFALGLVLPFLTGQIPQIGKMLSPMHLPVYLCGLTCGWPYGMLIGFLLPLTRSVLFGMPAIYPNALGMAFELATYGLVSGVVYHAFRKQSIWAVYAALFISMLCGRAVWGLAQTVMLGLAGNHFTLQAFLAGALINAIPGIILQLVLIPAVLLALDRAGIQRFRK